MSVCVGERAPLGVLSGVTEDDPGGPSDWTVCKMKKLENHCHAGGTTNPSTVILQSEV